MHSYYYIQFYFLWELIYVTVTDCVVSFFALVNGNGGSTVLVKQTELRGVNALPVLLICITKGLPASEVWENRN